MIRQPTWIPPYFQRDLCDANGVADHTHTPHHFCQASQWLFIPYLKSMGDQFTKSMVRFVLTVTTAALTNITAVPVAARCLLTLAGATTWRSTRTSTSEVSRPSTWCCWDLQTRGRPLC